MKKIYDCVIIRDELDILELRLKILNDKVDKFVICEADKTFTNISKPYTFLENFSRFEKWQDKIIYLPIELDDSGLNFSKKDTEFNPKSAAWQFEYQQRNALIYGLENIDSDDIIMLGDVDEIPNPENIKDIQNPTSCVMSFYYYFINNKSIGPQDKIWRGTTILKGSHLKQFPSIQYIRENAWSFSQVIGGWHWSYLGGKEVIKNKIQSFSHTEYNNESFYNDNHIEYCLNHGKDIFNRSSMNFQIIDIYHEYPSEILKILQEYPKFLHNN